MNSLLPRGDAQKEQQISQSQSMYPKNDWVIEKRDVYTDYLLSEFVRIPWIKLLRGYDFPDVN